MQRRRWLLLAVAIAIVGGGVYVLAEWNNRPAFTIDHTQPFWLEFGRGSGWHGLNTVKIDQTGRAVLHRIKAERNNNVTVLSWEVTTLQLSAEALAEVLKAVDSNGLMAMDEAYHEDIHDGTQWVLWIKQGDSEKSVYFDNNFPRRIKAFAEHLDSILQRAGMDKAEWQPVPRGDARHDRELWDSIKR